MYTTEVVEVFDPLDVESKKRLACWLDAEASLDGPRLRVTSVMRTRDICLPPGQSLAVIRSDRKCWLATPVQDREAVTIILRSL